MLFESLEEVQRMKQLIGIIQASKLPEMKGIDAFSLHNSCEFFFNNCINFEESQKNKKNSEEKKEEISKGIKDGVQEEEKDNKKIKKIKKALNKRGR